MKRLKYIFPITEEQRKLMLILIKNDWEIFTYNDHVPKGKLSFTKNKYIVRFDYINTCLFNKNNTGIFRGIKTTSELIELIESI